MLLKTSRVRLKSSSLYLILWGFNNARCISNTSQPFTNISKRLSNFPSFWLNNFPDQLRKVIPEEFLYTLSLQFEPRGAWKSRQNTFWRGTIFHVYSLPSNPKKHLFEFHHLIALSSLLVAISLRFIFCFYWYLRIEMVLMRGIRMSRAFQNDIKLIKEIQYDIVGSFV